MAGAAVAAIATPGFSQAVTTDSRASDARVIYMVIQAEPETTMGEVKEKFELARQATVGCNVREVLIEPIDPQTFTILRTILQKGLGSLRDKDASPQRELIQPMIGVDSAWSIDLTNPFEFIERVAVSVPSRSRSRDAPAETVTVSGAGPNPSGYALAMHSPGRYVLAIPEGVNPASITVDVVFDDGKADVQKRKIEQAWPAVGRAYLVTLADVVGDESLLFASLKDPTKVANPIREIQDATKASLMVASFVEVLGNRLRIQDGRITFTFPKPQGVSPKRLWLLFPLTATQLPKEKAALEAVLAEPDGFKQLPETIRRNVQAQETVEPGKGGVWIELPLSADGFTGVFEIDVAAWRDQLSERPTAVGDNALLVYEFENSQGTKLPLKMTEGYIVTDRIAEWLPALRSAD